MSEWQTFATMPYKGQRIIVYHEQSSSKECGLLVEIENQYYIAVARFSDEGMGFKLTTHLIPLRFFTHWKEI